MAQSMDETRWLPALLQMLEHKFRENTPSAFLKNWGYINTVNVVMPEGKVCGPLSVLFMVVTREKFFS